jgi:hypothetical protein
MSRITAYIRITENEKEKIAGSSEKFSSEKNE